MAKNNKLVALFAAVKSLFEEMKSVETDRGILYYDGDVLEVGTAVYDEAGPAEGEYIIDGKKFKVENGVVSEIEVIEPEEKPAEVVIDEMACGTKKMEAVPEEKADEPVAEEPKEEPKEPEMDKMAEVEGAIDSLKDTIAELTNKITQIDARLADIEKTPEAPTPHEEFSKLGGFEAIKAMRAANRIK